MNLILEDSNELCKIYSVEVPEYTSCEICSVVFQLQNSFYEPICYKKRCWFRKTYLVLQKFPNTLLKVFWVLYFPEETLPKKRQEVIFALTKEMIKNANS